MMYILGVSVMQVHHGSWVGTSCLFIGGSIYAYVGFLMESMRKGHLIHGAIVVSIGYFPHWTTLSVYIIYRALNI